MSSNSQKGEIEKLQKALTRWANNQGSPPRRADSTQRHLPHLQSQASRSSLRGLTPPDDQNLTISPLPDFTTNILLQALPGVDEGDEAEGEGSGSGEDSLEARTPGSREAAGYLRSSYEVLGGPSASPPQLAPSYSSEGTLPLLDDTPLHLPMQPPGLLSMTAPKDEPSVSHSSLFAHPSQSPSQRLQALLTDDRPVRPSSLPVHTEGFPVHSPQEGLKEKKGKKKREKKRDRAEKRPEVDIGLVPEMPFSFPLWKDVSTQEGAAPKSPTHCNPTPPTRRQSVPVNSTLFSHAPPEACQSFTGNASGGVKSPRRHSESKDQWRGYQHPNPYVVDENSVSRPSDTQHPGHYHYNDESGSWVTSGFGFF
ncbi:hypothetical protein D9758_009165 [Tetrapyrgos nigripes]|uniref:Uncharacterized protein n=1 Tax=Tetrapyrgos nigripes TaxID=182062 RepID=A0A8H5G8G4_9AGAR|nr:hypothetical protein D9758_009165 [Tetrapyrgos nigripes]